MNKKLFWHKGFNKKTYLYAALLSDLGLTKGTGTATFTRASDAYAEDNGGTLTKILSNSPSFPGMRPASNLLTYCTDFSNAAWIKFGTCTVTGTNLINFPAVDDRVYQAFTGVGGRVESALIKISGTPGTTITFHLASSGSNLKKIVTLTAIPKSYLVTDSSVIDGQSLVFVRRDAGDTATSATVEFIHIQNSSTPGDHVVTTSAPKTEWFDYENPFTVDGDGVVTDSGLRTPITGTKGFLSEPASTNKCTCYGVPRADAFGAVLNSGTATKGKVYEIVVRTGIDWSLVGTLLSGAANTAGAKYLITAALTFDADDTGKECIHYVGTKAYHDGTVFQNPIAGITLGGNVAAVLSIVNDQAEINAAKLGVVASTGKVYKFDNSLGSAGAYLLVSGTTGNTNLHSVSIMARMTGANPIRIEFSGGGSPTNITQTVYQRTKNEGKVPSDGVRTLAITITSREILYFIIPQLEELPFSSSVVSSVGATATRSATILSYPLTGNMPLAGARHIPTIYWTPKKVIAGRTEVIAYSGVDASNYIKVYSTGTTVVFEKKVAGVSEAATLTMTPVADTQYKIDPWFNANNTMDLKVDGTQAGTNTSTTLAPVFGTSIFIGSDGTSASFAQYQTLRITN